MKASDLRAFARRPWAEVEKQKAAYWLETRERDGASAVLAAADVLREHVAAFTNLGSETARSEDLAHHIELKRKLDEASRRLRR